jgi:hypothetical protein
MAADGLSRYCRHRQRFRSLIVATILLAVVVPVVTGAPSVASAAAPPVDLFVTSPPDPIPAPLGATATTSLTVGNLGHSELDVTIDTRSVNLLNNGKTRFGAGPDPRFAGRVTVTPSSLSLPARQERTVQVSVNMPAGLPPDDYFLGFLISPVINSPSVAVVNDVGGLVVLDVPGSRDRRLTAEFVVPSWLNVSLSGSASGFVRATSVGKSALSFTTTVETTGWPSPAPPYVEDGSQILPSGLSRNVPVRVTSWLGLGWYTFHATLVYDRTDQSTGEVTVSRTVFIVNPLWFFVILVIPMLWMWRKRRRRKNRKRGQHSAGRSASSEARKRQPVSLG